MTCAKTWRIPLEDLPFCGGTLAEDVVSFDGKTCLLPRGTDLGARNIVDILPAVMRQLEKRGIKSLAISRDLESYSLQKLQKIAEKIKVPFAQNLDQEIASHTISQIRGLSKKIAQGEPFGEEFSNLIGTGLLLAKETCRFPQILMSLSGLRSQDEYTFTHSLNVALLSGFLAKKMDPKNIHLIEIGHDRGITP